MKLYRRTSIDRSINESVVAETLSVLLIFMACLPRHFPATARHTRVSHSKQKHHTQDSAKHHSYDPPFLSVLDQLK